MASFGAVSPAAGLVVAKELAAIITTITKLAIDCQGAARIVRFHLAGLCKVASGEAGKKDHVLGAVDTVLSTLTEFVGTDVIPSVENVHKWVKVHKVKITGMKNRFSVVMNQRDALVRLLEESDEFDDGRRKEALAKLGSLEKKLRKMYLAVEEAETEHEKFEASAKELKRAHPAWSKVASFVLATGGAPALAGTSGQVMRGEALEDTELVIELIKEVVTIGAKKVWE